MSSAVANEVTDPAALDVGRVRKLYGGEVALDNVSFTVGRGEIHGLLGANGAGKSTLVRVIAGVEAPDAGTIVINGQPQGTHVTSAHARDAGLAHIDQQRALIPDLSIADNVALTVGFPRRLGVVDTRRTRQQANTALQRVGLHIDARRKVAELPIAEQTLVAIARALAVEAQLILLDEPTASLGAAESEMLYARLTALAATGVSCILVTHALNEALSICNRITVLRDGHVVETCDSAELDERRLAALIVGHEVITQPIAVRRVSAPSGSSAPVFAADDVRCPGLGPLTFAVQRGEVLGVTGLPDSGHLALGALLVGATRLEGGTMSRDGLPYAPRNPRDAVAARVAYVPPDRLRDGLAQDMTSRENLFFDGRTAGRTRDLRHRRERKRAAEILTACKVKPANPEAPISTLSGGNMQKVLIAKWLDTRPELLVLSEPTVGVDIAAREEIYEQIHSAAARDAAVVVISSDFTEVAALCHRALVIRYGRLFAELGEKEATVTRLTELSGAADKARESI